MRKHVGWISTTLIVLIYVVWGILNIERTNNDVGQILFDGSLLMFLGIAVANTLGNQGESNAEETVDYKATRKEFANAQIKAKPYINKAPIYCSIKNRQAYEEVRTDYLERVGLRYSDFFNDEAQFIGDYFKVLKDDPKHVKHAKRQRNKVIKATLNLKLTTISKSDLMSENNKSHDPLYIGRDKKQFKLEQNTKKFITKLATATISAMYVASLSGLDWGQVLEKLMWGGVMVVMGMLTYTTYYRFTLGEYRNRLIGKVDWLDELVMMSEKGLLDEREYEKQFNDSSDCNNGDSIILIDSVDNETETVDDNADLT